LTCTSPTRKYTKLWVKALAGRRDKFIIQAHLCTVWENNQYERTRDLAKVKTAFAGLLKNLQTDYIDVGMIHYIDALPDWQEVATKGVLDFAISLKKAGTVKAVGISSHNPRVALAAAQSGKIDVIMFSVNPCYDLQPASEDCEDLWDDAAYAKKLINMDPEREKLYATCQSLGVAITVMKPFGGGDLLDAELSPAGKALTPVQCLHYALTRPAVATICCGAHTVEEFKASLAYETATAAAKDYASAFASFPKISWEGHCMYCGHCAPCPKGIDVATVTKFLNLAKAQGSVPETVREHYKVLPHTAGECIKCGACEKRCPFGVKVRQNMDDAKKMFGK
jgi:predicted aldo/keto reductase-like oxidoreductase